MNMTEIEARGKIKYRIANEMRKYGENKEEYEDLEIALKVMKEIREYRELGTVEEFKALKEKNEPKKVVYMFDTDRNKHAMCPNCRSVPVYARYCSVCGQKVDWGLKGGAE